MIHIQKFSYAKRTLPAFICTNPRLNILPETRASPPGVPAGARTSGLVGIPDSGISLMGVVITGPIKRAVIAGSYTPLYTARVVACSRSEFRSGISDELVREQVSPLAVVPHNPLTSGTDVR